MEKEMPVIKLDKAPNEKRVCRTISGTVFLIGTEKDLQNDAEFLKALTKRIDESVKGFTLNGIRVSLPILSVDCNDTDIEKAEPVV